MDRIGDSLRAVGFAPPEGEIWFGDDAAVLVGAPDGFDLVLCSDAAVSGVHADLELVSPAALGFRAVVAALSDLAAMGATARCVVVSVCASPPISVQEIMDGAIEAAGASGCPVVGGDVTASPVPMVDAAALGLVPSGEAMRRDAAQPGDRLVVTGPLGASAAGLRALRAGQPASGAMARAHVRPSARLVEGAVARDAGVRCAMDLSDGLGLDLDRLARRSMVGIELDEVPVANGATFDEALGGGEDYELVLATSDLEGLWAAFEEAGLRAPIEIGRVVADASIRTLGGEPLVAVGFSHDVD